MNVNLRIDGGTIATSRGKLRAGLAIENGKIAAIGMENRLPKADRTIDASGKYILPGLVDPHVHFRYLDTPIDESFGLMTRSATAGGVTTVLPFIASMESLVSSLEVFRQIYELGAHVDGSFHAIIFKTEQISEIPALIEKGVTSFKFPALQGIRGSRGGRGYR